jgi:hypothetical protein
MAFADIFQMLPEFQDIGVHVAPVSRELAGARPPPCRGSNIPDEDAARFISCIDIGVGAPGSRNRRKRRASSGVFPALAA